MDEPSSVGAPMMHDDLSSPRQNKRRKSPTGGSMPGSGSSSQQPYGQANTGGQPYSYGGGGQSGSPPHGGGGPSYYPRGNPSSNSQQGGPQGQGPQQGFYSQGKGQHQQQSQPSGHQGSSIFRMHSGRGGGTGGGGGGESQHQGAAPPHHSAQSPDRRTQTNSPPLSHGRDAPYHATRDSRQWQGGSQQHWQGGQGGAGGGHHSSYNHSSQQWGGRNQPQGGGPGGPPPHTPHSSSMSSYPRGSSSPPAPHGNSNSGKGGEGYGHSQPPNNNNNNRTTTQHNMPSSNYRSQGRESGGGNQSMNRGSVDHPSTHHPGGPPASRYPHDAAAPASGSGGSSGGDYPPHGSSNNPQVKLCQPTNGAGPVPPPIHTRGYDGMMGGPGGGRYHRSSHSMDEGDMMDRYPSHLSPSHQRDRGGPPPHHPSYPPSHAHPGMMHRGVGGGVVDDRYYQQQNSSMSLKRGPQHHYNRGIPPQQQTPRSKSGGMGGNQPYDGMEDDDKGRGSYKCGRCGVPKKGHICPYQPKLKRRPDEPMPEMKNASSQVEMDPLMALRRLNIEIQGFPESYAADPSGAPLGLTDNVGVESSAGPATSGTTAPNVKSGGSVAEPGDGGGDNVADDGSPRQQGGPHPGRIHHNRPSQAPPNERYGLSSQGQHMGPGHIPPPGGLGPPPNIPPHLNPIPPGTPGSMTPSRPPNSSTHHYQESSSQRHYNRHPMDYSGSSGPAPTPQRSSMYGNLSGGGHPMDSNTNAASQTPNRLIGGGPPHAGVVSSGSGGGLPPMKQH